MASKKILHAQLRDGILAKLMAFLEAEGEEVLRTASNTIAFPCVDDDGNDEFIVITAKVPTGSRDGDAYDAYSEAEAYAMHTAEQAEKAKLAAEKKAKKIAKDKAYREQVAKAKAEHKAKKGEGEG